MCAHRLRPTAIVAWSSMSLPSLRSKRSAEKDGHQTAADRSRPDSGDDLFGSDVVAPDDLLKDGVVAVGESLQQFVAAQLGFCDDFSGDVGLGPFNSVSLMSLHPQRTLPDHLRESVQVDVPAACVRHDR